MDEHLEGTGALGSTSNPTKHVFGGILNVRITVASGVDDGEFSEYNPVGHVGEGEKCSRQRYPTRRLCRRHIHSAQELAPYLMQRSSG